MNSYDAATLQTLKKVAFDPVQEKSASYLASDMEVLDTHSAIEAVEILPIEVALRKYEWLSQLMHSLVPADKDEYVKEVARSSKKLGYFIRVIAGEKVTLPVYTCYMINSNNFTQCAHNIIIAEE